MDTNKIVAASFAAAAVLSLSPAHSETVGQPWDFPDVQVASPYSTVGNQAVAVNPKNANVFVAAYANQGTCWTRASTDGGKTWAAPKKLLAVPGKKHCGPLEGEPSVLWSPDGSRVYVAYGYSSPLETY